jgi:glycosyltransferase involved in cell wall biosynthesis
MRILIDLQAAQSEGAFRGIGRYALELTIALSSNNRGHEVFVALNRNLESSVMPLRKKLEKYLPKRQILSWGSLDSVNHLDGNERTQKSAELLREAFFSSVGADVILVMSVFEGFADDGVVSIKKYDATTPVVSLFYDLIPFLNQEHYLDSNLPFKAFYTRQLKALGRSDHLFTISEHSRLEGEDHLGFSGEIINISAGASEHFKQSRSSKNQIAVLERLGIDKNYLLYVGGVDERKNIPRLLQAYAMLPLSIREDHTLVLAGKYPEANVQILRDICREVEIPPGQVIFTGYIEDDDLVALYQGCALFVFPSWHEGFGLPVLEAMKCGAAVISGDTSSLPELNSCAEGQFNPFSEEEIAQKIQSVLESEALQTRLIESAKKSSSRFSWEKSADTVLDAFERLIVPKTIHRQLSLVNVCSRIVDRMAGTESEEELISLSKLIASNHTQIGNRTMFVDVSEVCFRDAGTGVQRVTKSVIMELLKSPPIGITIEPVYGKLGEIGYFYAQEFKYKLLGLSLTPTSEGMPIVYKSEDIFFGLDLQHDVVLGNSLFFNRLAEEGVNIKFLLHDLLPITHASYFPPHISSLHAKWLELVTRFDGVVCVSHSSADELRGWLSEHYASRKSLDISVSHNGADFVPGTFTKGLPIDSSRTLEFLSKKTSFITVGTLEPRKGQAETLDVFDRLWNDGMDVVLAFVGNQGWMVDELVQRLSEHSEAGRRLFWIKQASDEYLQEIYKASSALIAPSEAEGFGLPIVEAERVGLPVIARDIAVFREVANSRSLFFDDDLYQCVEAFVNNKDKSVEREKWLGWQESVDNLVGLLASEAQTQQIFVDVSELIKVDVSSGIQRVVKGILGNLLTLNTAEYVVHPVYAELHQSGYCYADVVSIEPLQMVPSTNQLEYRAGDIFLGLDFQPAIVPQQIGFYQRLRSVGVDVTFVVYDLLPVLKPEFFLEGTEEGFRNWLQTVCQFDRLACISNSVKTEVEAWMRLELIQERDLPLVSSFPLGSDIGIYELPLENPIIERKFDIERVSFLIVGTLEPRKAHNEVINAFEVLWRKGFDVQLVIVGKLGWLAEELEHRICNHPLIDRQLHWYRDADDRQLEKLYSQASCLIMASYGEGYGLPLVEAAAHHLPIIARDLPVFREIALEDIDFFTGDETALATMVEVWLTEDHSKLVPRIETYTWEEAAEAIFLELADGDRSYKKSI